MQSALLWLATFAVVVTQCTLANLITWGGVRFELMPAVVAYAAISTRWPLALWLAVVGGMFLDALSANRLGVSAVALAVVAVGGFAVRRMVFGDQWLAQFVVGGAAAMLYSVLVWAFLAMSGLGWAVSWAGAGRVFQVALMSLAVAPFFFRVMNRVRRWVGEMQSDWDTESE